MLDWRVVAEQLREIERGKGQWLKIHIATIQYARIGIEKLARSGAPTTEPDNG
jgi:hypothetical protein